MKLPDLNLASEPLVNRRPVGRVVVLLWILGASIAGLDVLLFVRHYARTSQARERQAEMRDKIADERRRVSELERQLEEVDLVDLNERAEFVNRQIAARVFSWSELFDHLVEVLPREVRLLSLTPKFRAASLDRRDGRTVGEGPREVPLEILGAARDDTDLLQLIDQLFAHPAFRDPDLAREVRNESGVYDFSLRVIYAPVVEVEGAAEPGDAAREAEAEAETDAETGDSEAVATAPGEAAATAAEAPPEPAAAAAEER